MNLIYCTHYRKKDHYYVFTDARFDEQFGFTEEVQNLLELYHLEDHLYETVNPQT